MSQLSRNYTIASQLGGFGRVMQFHVYITYVYYIYMAVALEGGGGGYNLNSIIHTFIQAHMLAVLHISHVGALV